MRNATLKSTIARIETIARNEYRDLTGQLNAMLDLWNKTFGDSLSPLLQIKGSLRTSHDGPVAMPATKRKARKDKGQKRETYSKSEPMPVTTQRKQRKPLTAQQKKNISMGRKLAYARKKLNASIQ